MSSLHVLAAVHPFPEEVALGLYRSLPFTQTLCLGCLGFSCTLLPGTARSHEQGSGWAGHGGNTETVS